MTKLTEKEKGSFLKLFNRGGYVLDFSTNDFNNFTMSSVGIALCEKYELSKGKSLTAFINEADEKQEIKLLFDLFDYYEENYKSEYTEDETEAYYSNISYSMDYSKTYKICKKIVEKIRDNSMSFVLEGTELKEKFSNEYISRQIDLMREMQKSNPTDAIGKAKELIESCCKTILEENGIKWEKNWDVGQLAGKTLKYLNLMPSNVSNTDPAADSIKAVLGNLRGIVTKLAEIRNIYGSGHGKSASYKGLEERHAKLAVNSSITFVTFLWDTFERSKKSEI